ncbi:hypothetical protein [Aeromonas schubertii]|uniref:hypothetical protein n=1 Tax=Aeromonas schubertii TaxID=652 RepID=UPI0010A87D19|nr:hypothetical protein [Aeromonas schubertii]QCG49458.1 hypothetical protein E2P79_17935 [Aeromonas schubertii]
MSRRPSEALAPTVSQDNYRRLDNRVTSILKRNWPADEISQWVGLLSGEEQTLACAILRSRYPRPALLALPASNNEASKPFQSRERRPTVPVHSVAGRPIGRRHRVEGLTPVVIEQSGTIRDASTGRTLWIAPGSPTDRANPGTAAIINASYRPTQHQVIADHRL